MMTMMMITLIIDIPVITACRSKCQHNRRSAGACQLPQQLLGTEWQLSLHQCSSSSSLVSCNSPTSLITLSRQNHLSSMDSSYTPDGLTDWLWFISHVIVFHKSKGLQVRTDHGHWRKFKERTSGFKSSNVYSWIRDNTLRKVVSDSRWGVIASMPGKN